MKYILALLICLSSTHLFSQNCELIAKYGIYDTRTTNYSRERAISFLNLFKRETNMTYQQAKDYSASIGIPIEGVLVQLGFDASEHSYRKFVESILSMVTYDEYYIEKVQIVTKTVSKDIVQILADCYRQDGIHARIENTEDNNISFLIVYYKKTGNSPRVKLKLTWNSRKEDLTVNGIKYNKKLDFTIGTDEVIRFALTRNTNVSIPFALNLNGGEFATIHSGTLAVYKTTRVSIRPSPAVKFIELKRQVLERTSQARHVGGGDEELKRFSSTHLFGSFTLGLQNDSTLVGNISATIKEEQDNWTQFSIQHTYNIYKAPPGYKIEGFRIADGAGYTSSFDKFQSNWETSEYVPDGPLSAYDWAGDSGRTQDQLEGCWIRPHLKAIIVRIIKK